ncbi:glyoxylate/succinic semialdehyde reductase 1 [Citrus sinensis]|nr:glyoxylate/succinic semialdehyde reductase 1 [Citrus sinensis]
MEVGFLGLGIMGKAISMNLLRNGFKVTVWNRTLSKCDELVAHGATVGGSPAEVIKKCTITIGMLADPAAALSVVFDKGGVLEQICPGKGYIDMSTVDHETSIKISRAITSKGGHFLEAPVSGSKQPAETGQLVILSAGEKDLGGIANPMFKGKGPPMLQSNYALAFPLKHQQKDMRLALALGDENAVSMPIAAAANEAFKKARSLGLGDNDFSAVFEVVKDLKRSS